MVFLAKGDEIRSVKFTVNGVSTVAYKIKTYLMIALMGTYPLYGN